jgi:hypothetical protein
MTIPAMQNHYVANLVIGLAAKPPIVILSRPPPF